MRGNVPGQAPGFLIPAGPACLCCSSGLLLGQFPSARLITDHSRGRFYSVSGQQGGAVASNSDGAALMEDLGVVVLKRCLICAFESTVSLELVTLLLNRNGFHSNHYGYSDKFYNCKLLHSANAPRVADSLTHQNI